MERITYRITLDAHRNGIQRTLQGFETADNMARRISVNLVAGRDTYELPMANIVAMMYVTTPSAKEPSIHNCVIDGNTIIYDVDPITEEGITEMQLKVMGTSIEGATGVLIAPRFAVEVGKSNTDDEGVTQTPTFTALEDAIAKALSVYDSRLKSIELDDDFIFRVSYADGTTYESDILKLLVDQGTDIDYLYLKQYVDRTMLPKENVECIEYSFSVPSAIYEPEYKIYVPYPVGFTQENTFIAGCLLKKGEDAYLRQPKPSEGENVELGPTSVIVTFGELTEGEHKLAYKLVLIKRSE